MRRSDFLRWGTGLFVAAAVGLPSRSFSRSGSPLHRWATRYGGHVTDSDDGWKIVISPARSQCSAALRGLDAIAGSPLICRGNRISGSFHGVPFEARLECRPA